MRQGFSRGFRHGFSDCFRQGFGFCRDLFGLRSRFCLLDDRWQVRLRIRNGGCGRRQHREFVIQGRARRRTQLNIIRHASLCLRHRIDCQWQIHPLRDDRLVFIFRHVLPERNGKHQQQNNEGRRDMARRHGPPAGSTGDAGITLEHFGYRIAQPCRPTGGLLDQQAQLPFLELNAFRQQRFDELGRLFRTEGFEALHVEVTFKALIQLQITETLLKGGRTGQQDTRCRRPFQGGEIDQQLERIVGQIIGIIDQQHQRKIIFGQLFGQPVQLCQPRLVVVGRVHLQRKGQCLQQPGHIGGGFKTHQRRAANTGLTILFQLVQQCRLATALDTGNQDQEIGKPNQMLQLLRHLQPRSRLMVVTGYTHVRRPPPVRRCIRLQLSQTLACRQGFQQSFSRKIGSHHRLAQLLQQHQAQVAVDHFLVHRHQLEETLR